MRLARAEVRFVVVGGIAVSLQGYVRLTEDVDIILDCEKTNVLRFLEALAGYGEGFAREFSPEDFVPEEGALRLIEETEGCQLDIFTVMSGKTYADLANDAEVFNVQNLEVLYASKKSLIELKSNTVREKDQLDVQALRKLEDDPDTFNQLTLIVSHDTIASMRSPFTIAPEILRSVSQIERLIGRIEGLEQPKPQPHLRKSNRVRTVQGSLAIEGNTLDLDQVTALLEGKRVVGRKEEVTEVLNAIKVYDGLARFNSQSTTSFLKAHKIMMTGLIPGPGKWRSKNVGILKGSAVSHIAPKSDRVPHLMEDLFLFLKNDDLHPLIRSCVFHYELEFIHPFQDGNGRMGRFWQTLLLFQYHEVFEFIPIESLIRDRQEEYYAALEASDRSGESTAFVHFSLNIIQESLEDFLSTFVPKPLTATERLSRAKKHFGAKEFSRKHYLALFKTISTATASRDLKQGIQQGLLTKQGDKALATYQYSS